MSSNPDALVLLAVVSCLSSSSGLNPNPVIGMLVRQPFLDSESLGVVFRAIRKSVNPSDPRVLKPPCEEEFRPPVGRGGGGSGSIPDRETDSDRTWRAGLQRQSLLSHMCTGKAILVLLPAQVF